jgi:DNA-directed RNA polymerase subunit RPC12/RpoP
MEKKNSYEGRLCITCGKLLPLSQRGEECEDCQEHRLFIQVRDYIRHNDVSEAKVAEKFGISTRKIQKWIDEDKIQITGVDCDQNVKGRCARCGELLKFGNYCATCLRMMKREERTSAQMDLQNLKLL